MVYLQRKGSDSLPTPEVVADRVVETVRAQARHRLKTDTRGFKRANIGIKYADYYETFFDKAAMVTVGTSAATKLMHAGRAAKAADRYAKMIAGERLAETVDLDLPADIRVDQLAEWCYLMERLLAGTPVGPQAAAFLLNQMRLDDLRADFLAVPRDSRAGGVGYHWYLAAGHYLKRNPGLSPAACQDRLEAFAHALHAWLLQSAPALAQPPQAAALEDLRAYVASVVSFGPAAGLNGDGVAPFATELHRYTNAKRRGRGTTAMCSLCSSAYTVEEQREAAILFAPQVYSNKLNLHGAKAIRDICSICGLEMMLRQLFMNQTNAGGGDFEKRNFRYLYLYPTYFFTPETLRLVGHAYNNLRHIQFTAGRGQSPAVTPATRAWLRVTTLTDAVYDVFSHYLLLSQRPAFRLGEVVCDITHVDGVAVGHPWAGYTTLAELASLTPSTDRWTLEFASPTAIRWGEADSGVRRVELFPQPRMALAGLRKHWDDLTGETWDRAFEEWVERNVGVGRVWAWATQPVVFQRQTYLGGQGKLEYRVLDARGEAQIAHLHRLLHLAFYTGIGYKTTHGLGQVRVVAP